MYQETEWKVPQPIGGSGTAADPFRWESPGLIGSKARYCRDCGGRLYTWQDSRPDDDQPYDGCIC